MSASSSPTERPSPAKAQARLTETVDLPTPPLPLATAITRRTWARRSAGAMPWVSARGSAETWAPPLRTRVTPGPGGLAAEVSATCARSTPGTAFSAADGQALGQSGFDQALAGPG